MSLHHWTPKNNGVVLLVKTILLHRNCFLFSVAADGEDGNGLKLENVCQFFQVVTMCVEKKAQKLFWIALPGKIHLISSS